MAELTLTLRRVQIELLEAACADRRRARVVWSLPGGGLQQWNTRFVAMGDRELWLDLPAGEPLPAVLEGADVDVFFAHEEQALAIRTRTRGAGMVCCARRGSVRAWRLDLPLFVEQRQQRAQCRVSLAEDEQVTTRFTRVESPEVAFDAWLVNISAGGLAAEARAEDVPDVTTDSLWWASFRLPGDDEPFEFVVRVVHVRELRARGAVALGCSLCPHDDPQRHDDQIRRMARFLSCRRQGERRDPADVPAGG